MDMSGMGWLMMLLMVVGAVLLIAAIAVAVWLVVRSTQKDRAELPESAREVLDRRLAAGEISSDEYYERESALRSAEPARRRRVPPRS